MIIKVEQQDIDSGIKGDSDFCPVALAVKRLYPKHPVDVGGSFICWLGTHTSFSYTRCMELPEKAQQFILDFDHGKKVKPLTFEIGNTVN